MGNKGWFVKGHPGRPTHTKSKRKKVSSEYKIWVAMKERCYNSNNCNFKFYGAKGIRVCDRWRHSFENFLADMDEKPEGCSLDRFPDNKGDYGPDNCRWATKIQQQNNLTSNKLLTYDGRCMTQAQWSREMGITEQTIHVRLRRGWPIEKALTHPVRARSANKIAAIIPLFLLILLSCQSKQSQRPKTTIDSSGSHYKIPYPKILFDSFPGHRKYDTLQEVHIDKLVGLRLYDIDNPKKSYLKGKFKVNADTIYEVQISSFATRDTLGNWKITNPEKALELFYQAYMNDFNQKNK